MYFSITNIFNLVIVASVAAMPVKLDKRAEIIIGYRRAEEELAKLYNEKGLIWYPRAYMGEQIGPGVYASPTRDEYNIGVGDRWYCVIKADSTDWDRIPKAWIPHTWTEKDGTNLWGEGTTLETRRGEYIKSLEEDWIPGETIRLSWILNGKKTQGVQLLIPKDLVNKEDGATMSFSVHCVPPADKDEITNEPVDYDSWTANVKGRKGPQEPAPSQIQTYGFASRPMDALAHCIQNNLVNMATRWFRYL